MDLEKVKTAQDCIEQATVDAYDDCEQLEGWVCCFDEIFNDIKKVRILGEDVSFKGVQSDQGSVLAMCEKNKFKAKVSLDSLELIKPTKQQSLWLKAWRQWSSNR